MMPIKRQVISRADLDGIWGLNVAHDIASQVDRVEVLDGRVGIASCVRTSVVCWGSNALEETLIYTIDKDALGIFERQS